MRVVLSDDHQRHNPQAFISRGNRVTSPETPERAAIFRAAVERGGHTILSGGPVDRAALLAIHHADYLSFLENAWTEWSALPDHAPEILPNVHPGRNMDIHPTHIVGKAGHYQADTACPIGPGTFEGALASAGVATTAADLVLSDFKTGGTAPHAYALCRPPGHHA